jgi:hypothetical protein
VERPECDREIRPRSVRKDTPEWTVGRKSRIPPNGKATSDSRGPVTHHGGLAVQSAQAEEAAVPQRRGTPARAGAGWGRDDLGRGKKTQGRSESRLCRKVQRGFGTRRRSKASRLSESRRTSRDRELATAHGAGEVENAPPPGRDCRASGSEVRGFAGVRAGRFWVERLRAQPLRRQEHPVRYRWPFVRARKRQVEGDGGCGGPGNRPEHPHSRRDVVAALLRQDNGALGVKPRSTAAQAADRG